MYVYMYYCRLVESSNRIRQLGFAVICGLVIVRRVHTCFVVSQNKFMKFQSYHIMFPDS